MSNPLPPNFNAPLFPGFQNSQIIDHATARALLAQVSPDYQNNEAARVQMNAYLDQVAADEFVFSPRRVAEIAGAAAQVFRGDATQIARQQLVERGQAVDRSKLPPTYAAQIANIPDETIIEAANYERSVRPELTQKQAVDLWISRAAKMQDGLNPQNVVGVDSGTGINQSIKGVTVGNAG